MMRWLLVGLVVFVALGCSSTKVYHMKMTTYYPPKMAHKLPAKVKVAVLGGRRSGVRAGIADQVARRIERWLQRDPRYSIIERELLKEIMAEKELAETGLLERQAELTAKAKMRGVDALILVEVSYYNAKKVRITKYEKKVVRSSTVVPFIYKSGGKTRWGVVPLVSRKEKVVPVDYYIPGCPPRPEAILYGVAMALGLVPKKVGKKEQKDFPEFEEPTSKFVRSM